MKKTFSFDAGHSICTAIYKNKVFTGEAHCHPEDADFESERVGLYIAEVRADINILTYIRDCELKPAYNALNHIQSSFKRSSHYNPNSYEAKHIRKQLRVIENQLTVVSNELATLKSTLTAYIKDKDAFYQRIRKGRNKQ
jgi:hypothetical protein